MDDLLRATFVLVLLNLLIVPFVLALGALFPDRLGRTRTVAALMPGRAFVVGLINFLFFGAIGLAFSALADGLRNELPRVPALVVLAVLSIAVSFGLAALAQLVGARLRPQASELKQTIWGALVLSLGSSLPFIGWLALLPYAGLLGLGALILSFFYREKATGGGL